MGLQDVTNLRPEGVQPSPVESQACILMDTAQRVKERVQGNMEGIVNVSERLGVVSIAEDASTTQPEPRSGLLPGLTVLLTEIEEISARCGCWLEHIHTELQDEKRVS